MTRNELMWYVLGLCSGIVWGVVIAVLVYRR